MRARPILLVAATCGLFLLIVVFHLASARAGYSHYRDQHLGTAIEYAAGQIDLLRPVIVGFTASATPIALEVPIWQALAGALFKLLGPWFGWANLLSLGFFATGLWPLFALAKHYLGERGAWWTLIFFLAQPIIVLVSGQASTDGLSLVLAIWFLFCADRLVRTERMAWLAPTIVFGSLAATAKLPLFMGVGLTSFFLLLAHAPRSFRAWGLLATTGIASAAALFLWTRYTNGCIAQAEFAQIELRLTPGGPMWFWYFGDWAYRLNPANWMKGGWAALNVLFGSFALVALAGWSLLFGKNRAGRAALAGAFCTTLVFSHLVLVHRHYFVLYSVAVALLSASAVLRLEDQWNLQKGWQQFVSIAGISGALLLASVQGLIGMEVVLNYDPYPKAIAEIVRQQTSPTDKLLLQGGGWGGNILILSQRRGLSITDTQLLESAANRARLRQLGYTKLVMISESPLLGALQQTNPGSASRQRESYRATLTPVAAPWPVVFESADILVKDFPEEAP
jgi:hypothetical protein